MEWSVENNLVCPTTGTAFALTSGAENLKFILWYKGDYFLRTGSVISPEDSGVLANGKKRNIKILHVFPYSNALWASLHNRIDCPGNGVVTINHCARQQRCVFTLCPYGARTVTG